MPVNITGQAGTEIGGSVVRNVARSPALQQ